MESKPEPNLETPRVNITKLGQFIFNFLTLIALLLTIGRGIVTDSMVITFVFFVIISFFVIFLYSRRNGIMSLTIYRHFFLSIFGAGLLSMAIESMRPLDQTAEWLDEHLSKLNDPVTRISEMLFLYLDYGIGAFLKAIFIIGFLSVIVALIAFVLFYAVTFTAFTIIQLLHFLVLYVSNRKIRQFIKVSFVVMVILAITILWLIAGSLGLVERYSPDTRPVSFYLEALFVLFGSIGASPTASKFLSYWSLITSSYGTIEGTKNIFGFVYKKIKI